MLFNFLIEGFLHLPNYFSEDEQIGLWQSSHQIFEQQPIWRPLFVYGKDKDQSNLVMPYALENTNCGKYGWLADEQGQRYSKTHPSGSDWVELPETFLKAVNKIKSDQLIPENFNPENCLINKYQDQQKDGQIKPSRLGLHRDKSENNLHAPIISISLGLSAVFLIGGLEKTDQVSEIIIKSGDLVILGGGLKGARNAFHGVKCIIPQTSPSFLNQTDYRINLTIRQVN